jgi:Uma2 family endonuclease
MAVNASINRLSIEEFLKGELSAETKHELAWGLVRAMSGGSRTHVSITPALHEICRRSLRGSSCRYLDQDTKIVVEEANSAYYPDGAIACPPHFVNERSAAIDNPAVVFEVLSPSTEARDRGEKFQNYALLPSLKDYVLISTDRRRIEVFSRQEEGSWLLRIYLEGAIARVPSVDLDLSLTELYEDVAFGPPDSESAT